MRILLVNDMEGLLKKLRELLATEHQVIEAADGDEALRLYEERGPFDVVLTDIDHPGPSGFELLDAIRQKNANQRFGFVTGGIPKDVPEVVKKCPLLLLPVESQQLMEFVRKWF